MAMLQATELMWQLKELFDPEFVLNPGVILNHDLDVHLKNLKPSPAASPLVSGLPACSAIGPPPPPPNPPTPPSPHPQTHTDTHARARAHTCARMALPLPYPSAHTHISPTHSLHGMMSNALTRPATAM